LEIIRVIHNQSQLRQPRLVQAGDGMAVAADDPLVHHAQAGDGVANLAHGGAVQAGKASQIVSLVVIERAQRQLHTHLAGRHGEGLPDFL
jgi:hypothetical protein